MKVMRLFLCSRGGSRKEILVTAYNHVTNEDLNSCNGRKRKKMKICKMSASRKEYSCFNLGSEGLGQPLTTNQKPAAPPSCFCGPWQ